MRPRQLLIFPLRWIRWATVASGFLVACSSNNGVTPPPSVASISVAPDTATLSTGATLQLSATVRDSAKNVLTGRSITWASENPSIASVSSSGLVTAVAVGGPVHLTATSGSQSAAATISVIPPANGMIGPQGGTVATPSGGATVTFSSGAVSSPIPVQVRDTQPAAAQYSVLSAHAIELVLPLTANAAAFQPNGSVQVSIPISRDVQTGAIGYVRARFKGVPGEFWAPATSTGNGRLSLSIPSAGFPDFKSILGLDTLDVVFDVEEFSPTPPSSLRSSISRAFSVFGPLANLAENCPGLPGGADPTVFAVCDTGTLQQLRFPGAGSNNGIGIVLVHGWLQDVTGWASYYRAQGIVCPIFGSCSVVPPAQYGQPGSPVPTLPAQVYFRTLISALEASPDGLSGAPIYVYNYQSYRTVLESGQELFPLLQKEKARLGLAGFVLIGHSMGGLVARIAAQQLEAQSPSDAQTILGIISLATPHLGTPLATPNLADVLVAGVLAPAIWTPGGQSLAFALARTEHTPLYAYGGDIENEYSAHGIYAATWALLYRAGAAYRANDGVVPTSSSLPLQFIGTGAILRSTYNGYDHGQMANGLDASTFAEGNLYSSILGDLTDLLQRAGAVSLAFNQLPTAASAGATLLPAVTVEVRDGLNRPISTARHSYQVAIAFANNPTGATLSGTTMVNSVNGVATFADLSIDRAGSGYTLVATAVGLSTPPSGSVTVSTPAATIVATPSTSDFIATAGAVLPAAQTVSITKGGGGTLTGLTRGTITYRLGETAGWLGTATLNSTTTPATLTLQPNTTNLAAATTYHATVPLSATGGISNRVSVTYTVSTAGTGGSLTANGNDTCSIPAGNSAQCWGLNVNAQLGDGTYIDRALPVQVVGGGALVSVTAGQNQTCGLTATGAAYCWGANTYGQLGDGTFTNHTTPVPVAGGITFSSLAIGGETSCGLTPAGTAYCWGRGDHGRVGDGSGGPNRNSPVLVAGGLTFARLTASAAHTCGRTTAGAAYCWGYNVFGQLGDGTTTDRSAPVPVVGGFVFAALAAGELHTCGLTTGVVAYCWGLNANGQVGDGTGTNRTTPTPIVGGPVFAGIVASGNHSCGLTASGAAYCWGQNLAGGLGDGTTTDRSTPVLVVGGLLFATLAPGGQHTCGLTTVGVAYCWGSNTNGQIGDGTTTDRLIPTPVR